MGKPGTFSWADLTVPHADAIRDFYTAVIGWSALDHDIGDYADYEMCTPDGEARTGICWRSSVNASVPPQWLIYVSVTDLDRSIAEVNRRGGSVVGDVRGEVGADRLCVIQDPSGAVMALWEQHGDFADRPADDQEGQALSANDPGTFTWVDLSVSNTDEIRDFYTHVVGWTPMGLDMGGYEDYVMMADGDGVTGVCWKRGINADLPSVWLMYVNVADLDDSLARVVEHGGKIIGAPRGDEASWRFCCIQDPAGAHIGLIQMATSDDS